MEEAGGHPDRFDGALTRDRNGVVTVVARGKAARGAIDVTATKELRNRV